MAVCETSPSLTQVTWADLELGEGQVELRTCICKTDQENADLCGWPVPEFPLEEQPSLGSVLGRSEHFWSRGRVGCVVVCSARGHLGKGAEPSGQDLEMPLAGELLND